MSIPVITVAQMREWERATWALNVTEDSVMRRAGQAVARLAERLTRPDDFILFLAGKGHNGDDTAYACEFLAQRPRALLRVNDPEVAAQEILPHLERGPALIVDGLFGTGLNRPLAPAWIKFIEQINAARRPVLAVDVPSGLSAEEGESLRAAIRASITLTLGAVKRGLLEAEAAPFVGRLEVAADIGLAPCPFATEMRWVTADDFKNFPPPRPASGHKGTFGHLVILAGSMGYHGAAVLAARAAQRAQPGLISVVTMPAVYMPVAAQLQAVMVAPWTEEWTFPSTATAIVLGPGLAAKPVPESLLRLVRRLWLDSPQAVIADASALDWLPSGACAGDAVRVITPHPGEAGRMLRMTAAEVQSNRPQAVRELSRRFGHCHVVLKGQHTMVGRDGESLFVNSSGNSRLAQGGSGDVLAGYLGGWLAQPELRKDAGAALRFGVWRHGATADALEVSQPNFTIEELAVRLGTVGA